MKFPVNKDIKAFAFDLDGTLTNSQKKVTPKTKDVLKKLQSEGNVLILASGRPLAGVLPVANELNFQQCCGYIICFNGAMIYDCQKQQTILDITIPSQFIEPIIKFGRKVGIASLTYDKRGIITEKPNDSFVAIESRNNNLPIFAVQNIIKEITFPVEKIMFVGEPSLILSFYSQIVLAFPQLDIYRSDPYFLEIMNKGVNKSASLGFLLKKLSLTSEQLASFGDGINDIPMLDYSGISIAMENSNEEVKKHASFITKSNDEDGIAYAINLLKEVK